MCKEIGKLTERIKIASPTYKREAAVVAYKDHLFPKKIHKRKAIVFATIDHSSNWQIKKN